MPAKSEDELVQLRNTSRENKRQGIDCAALATSRAKPSCKIAKAANNFADSILNSHY
jgi:hypothetical protein